MLRRSLTEVKEQEAGVELGRRVGRAKTMVIIPSVALVEEKLVELDLECGDTSTFVVDDENKAIEQVSTFEESYVDEGFTEVRSREGSIENGKNNDELQHNTNYYTYENKDNFKSNYRDDCEENVKKNYEVLVEEQKKENPLVEQNIQCDRKDLYSHRDPDISTVDEVHPDHFDNNDCLPTKGKTMMDNINQNELPQNQDLPHVHKPLKDLINKTNRRLYNVDSSKVTYKAGLSKRRAELPSLHPRRRMILIDDGDTSEIN